jgi:chitin synthase
MDFKDLSKLDGSDFNNGNEVKEASIIGCLNERFKNGLIYTSIGPTCLVSINPCKYLDLYSEAVCNLYSQALEKGSTKPPHIFGMAANAFYDMISTGRDQTIVCQ